MTLLFRNIFGPLVASIIAGPVLVTGQFIVETAEQRRIGLAGSENDMFTAVIVLIGIYLVSMLVGFFASIIPNLVGTAAMWLLGRRQPALRHPGLWGLAGALAAGAFALSDAVGSELPGRPIAYAVTGAICALACRVFARWANDSVA